MKIKLKVEYSESDVERIVIEDHTKHFGVAPVGMEWKASDYYGTLIIEAVEKEEEKPIGPETPVIINDAGELKEII